MAGLEPAGLGLPYERHGSHRIANACPLLSPSHGEPDRAFCSTARPYGSPSALGEALAGLRPRAAALGLRPLGSPSALSTSFVVCPSLLPPIPFVVSLDPREV